MTKRSHWFVGLVLAGHMTGTGAAQAQEEEILAADSSVVLVADTAGRLLPVEVGARPAAAERFWADPATGVIRRGGLDGSRGQDLVAGLAMPYGLAYDARSGAFLWTSSGEETVQRFVLGDRRPLALRSEFAEPYAIVVADKSAETTYLVLSGQVLAVRHSLADASDETTILLEFDPELTPLHGLALDEAAGVLYVGDGYGRMVQRIDLGSHEVSSLAFVVEPFGSSTEVVR